MAFRWIGKSADGSSVSLRRLEGCPIRFPAYATNEWNKLNHDILRLGVVVDVETTGLNHSDDEIIELGLRQFIFNRSTGEILRLGKEFCSFQDPGRSIPPEITQLTGITDEMVSGKSIQWDEVNALIADASVIIAHNARFDRPFLDRKSKVSADKIWSCSLKQIDWSSRGYTSSKLELLNIYHGFFTESHRAINDVDALLYLISLDDPTTAKPYLFDLLNNARRLTSQVIAMGAPFDAKDFLKQRGYGWDSTNRFWSKVIFKDDVSQETTWLEENVYFGPSRGIVHDIALADAFKAKN